MFSIVIPTWNSLDHLKLCIESIKKHSTHEHEILVHVNEGSDSTLDWVRAQGIKHSYSRQNIGVCLSTNYLAAQASRDWLLYLNDDMVCCPGWDAALVDAVRATPTDLAMFFSTLIEPTDTGNSVVLVQNFGRTPAEFDEGLMLANYSAPPPADIEGRGSQPMLVHRMWWQMVGGYSLEFSPGMSSDDDLLMKFWVLGCRDFRIVGASRVYHFVGRSTGRVRRNCGGRAFVMKWGITQKEFKQNYLSHSRGARTPDGKPSRFPHATSLGSLRRIAYAVADYPLGDLAAWDPAPGRHLTPLG